MSTTFMTNLNPSVNGFGILVLATFGSPRRFQRIGGLTPSAIGSTPTNMAGIGSRRSLLPGPSIITGDGAMTPTMVGSGCRAILGRPLGYNGAMATNMSAGHQSDRPPAATLMARRLAMSLR